jgi:hypothetical protein
MVRYRTQAAQVRKLAIGFLLLQGTGTLAWWVLLMLYPPARMPFLAPGAPDSTLMVFIVPDLVIFISSALVAAYGLVKNRDWTWTALCVQMGAAVYAALYALALPLFSGGAWLGAAMMLPSLILLPLFSWLLRPESLR